MITILQNSRKCKEIRPVVPWGWGECGMAGVVERKYYKEAQGNTGLLVVPKYTLGPLLHRDLFTCFSPSMEHSSPLATWFTPWLFSGVCWNITLSERVSLITLYTTAYSPPPQLACSQTLSFLLCFIFLLYTYHISLSTDIYMCVCVCIHVYVCVCTYIYIILVYVYLPTLDSRNFGTRHFVLFTALSPMPKMLSGI